MAPDEAEIDTMRKEHTILHCAGSFKSEGLHTLFDFTLIGVILTRWLVYRQSRWCQMLRRRKPADGAAGMPDGYCAAASSLTGSCGSGCGVNAYQQGRCPLSGLICLSVLARYRTQLFATTLQTHPC